MYNNVLLRHTLRMRIKSCLSTRRKWQLSSLKMMVAARGASFSKASCPKSSPSCSVVTRPCMHKVLSTLHYTYPGKDTFQGFQFRNVSLWQLQWIYLPMCDYIHRAFPDDVPRSAFVPLTEHYITNRQSVLTLFLYTRRLRLTL